MSVTSAGDNPDVVDLKKHSAVFVGNVIITQGTLEIHADRVEVSQDPDGKQPGLRVRLVGQAATFRQKRDGVDEYSEGDAARSSTTAPPTACASSARRTCACSRARSSPTRPAALITYDTATDTIKLGSGDRPRPTRTAPHEHVGRPDDSRVHAQGAQPTAKEPPPLELDTPTPASGPAK